MDLLPGIAHGHAILGNASLVAGDERVGRVDDGLRRPVIALQAEGAGALEILHEVEDVLDLGAAEAVDGLGIVPDHAQVVMDRGELPEDEVLGHVGVLVLVHQDVAETAGDAGERLRIPLQQDIHVQEDIVEIHHAGLLAQLAVQGVDPMDFRLLVEPVVLQVAAGAVGVRRGGDQVVLGLGDAGEHLLGLIHLVIQPQLLDAGLEGTHGIRGVINGKGLGETQPAGPLPEEADEHGMEGSHPQPAGLPLPYHERDAFLHLTRGFFGKSKGKDPVRGHALVDQIGYSGSQYAGLARSGARDNQYRPLHAQDSFALFLIQTTQNLHFSFQFIMRI